MANMVHFMYLLPQFEKYAEKQKPGCVWAQHSVTEGGSSSFQQRLQAMRAGLPSAPRDLSHCLTNTCPNEIHPLVFTLFPYF